MEILYLLIPLSVVLVFLIGAIFWWSVKSGQFDDLEGPGYRVLMDDDRPSAGRAGSKMDGTPKTQGAPADSVERESESQK